MTSPCSLQVHGTDHCLSEATNYTSVSPVLSFISITFLYSTCPKKYTFFTLFNSFHLSLPFNIYLQNDHGKGPPLRSSSYLFSSYIIHALITFSVQLFFFYCYCTHSLCFFPFFHFFHYILVALKWFPLLLFPCMAHFIFTASLLCSPIHSMLQGDPSQ